MQNAPNGERNVSTCHYLDADSAMIDGKKWNLLEFAKEMEKRGIMLAPMELCQVPERGEAYMKKKDHCCSRSHWRADRIPDLEKP